MCHDSRGGGRRSLDAIGLVLESLFLFGTVAMLLLLVLVAVVGGWVCNCVITGLTYYNAACE